MNDYKKIAEFYSSINKEMAQASDEKKALLETYDKLMKTFKLKMGNALSYLEKEIEDGKVTNSNTIQGVQKLREQYNAMFADDK